MNFKIGNKLISKNSKPYFIADIGANHDGSLSRAYKLIELAKNAGADAAKFQNFQANKIVSKYGFDNLGGKLSHQSKWKKSVYEVYEDASVSFEWTSKLKEKCDEFEIEYFTSPYDFESVDKVDPFLDVYKIGSGDITWIEIIEYIAKKGKPVLLATGASEMNDVKRAYNALKLITNEIVLMQCNTNYTGDNKNFNYINLNVLKTYKKLFPNVILGLSDHTTGHSTVLGALALGATVFEKHFTDDNKREGPDHKFAMNPKSWSEMVQRSNELYLSLGDGVKIVEDNEKESIGVQRRSIRAAIDIKKGDTLSKDKLEFLRPIGKNDIEPYRIDEVVGKKSSIDIKKGDSIQLNKITI
jgi:N-acetylneuraminate synthase